MDSPVVRARGPSKVRSWVATHPLVTYVALAYGLSWSSWLPMALSGARTRAGLGWPTHLPGLLGPAVAAVIVTALVSGRDGLRDLAGRSWRWRVPGRVYAVVAATAGLIALAPLSRAVAGETPPDVGDYFTYSGIGVLPGIVTMVIVVAVNGFGEEVGWRGFLAHSLLPRHGVVRTGLLVAPVWAMWHLPLFWVVANFVDLGVGGTVGWFIGLTAGSVLLTWLYEGSGRSIALVALWHSVFNLVTATDAGAGVPAAAASTLVMAAAVAIGIGDALKRRRRHGA